MLVQAQIEPTSRGDLRDVMSKVGGNAAMERGVWPAAMGALTGRAGGRRAVPPRLPWRLGARAARRGSPLSWP